MATKKRSWKAAQPHNAKNGRIVTRKFANKNPSKVEWVRAKKSK